MTPVTDPGILAQLNGGAGMKPVTDPAVLAQLNAPEGPPPQTSQTLGFEQGVGNFIANAAQPAIWAGKKLGLPTDTFEQGANLMRNPEHDANVVPGKIGRAGADILETLPMAATLPATLPGALAGGAAAGALTGDPDHPVRDATIGAATGGTMNLAGRAIAPTVSDAVQRLAASGAQLTPGQIFGGMTKGVEDRLAGLPLVGDFITGAQNRSLETAGRGAINRSLTPIGQTLPAGLVGQDAIKSAGDTLSANYNSLLPQMNVTLDQPFGQALSDAGQRVDARLPDEMGDQFKGTVADVFKKLNSTGPTQPSQYGGVAAHEAASDLGAMSRKYSGLGGNDSELGNAYGSVDQAFRDAARRSNPQLGPQLDANDEGWANLVRLEDASKAATGNANGKAPGVFTGQQLRTAARQGDTSVRDRATARGDALLQDHAEDMIQTLPSSVGDSGTAGRTALAALLAGGATHLASPAAVAAGAAIPAIYSQPGISLITKAFAHGATPTQTALGGLIRGLAVPAAGAVGIPQRRP